MFAVPHPKVIADDDDDPFVRRDLFGGAFVADVLATFEDISQFRDMPDNQEVFADATTDCSCQVEIAEPPDSVANVDAARYDRKG
jgi:hypothetical protein